MWKTAQGCTGAEDIQGAKAVAQFCFALLCFTQTRPLRGPPTGPRSPKV